MVVTLEEMKNYLRVDFEEDDLLMASFISAAEKAKPICRWQSELMRRKKMFSMSCMPMEKSKNITLNAPEAAGE